MTKAISHWKLREGSAISQQMQDSLEGPEHLRAAMGHSQESTVKIVKLRPKVREAELGLSHL